MEDNVRPDGTTLLPRAKGKPLAWDVTTPYTQSHVANTCVTPGAPAYQAAQHKRTKYASLTSTRMFCPLPLRRLVIPQQVQYKIGT